MSAAEKPKQDQAQANMLTVQQAAGLLKLTGERVRQLARQGWIPKAARGMYPLVGTVQGYIEFLRDEARRSTQNAAANKLKDAKTKEAELRIDERLRKLVPIEEANSVVAEIVGTYRAEYGGLAGKATSDPALRRKIQAEVDASQGRISVLLAKRLAALANGDLALEADAEGDA